tara:strand:- start:1124 stop:1675 length:552 start_codon:yes stop_codon:yes gene_type:complete
MKRLFDFLVAILLAVLFFWMLLLAWFSAAIATRSNGVFIQRRVGRYGMLFSIYKLRTIHLKNSQINKVGVFLRRYKFDELPQLLNVIKGDMSFVGPRPDIPGYADMLTGEDRKILELRPGITSVASLKYVNEEEILKNIDAPQAYNNTIIYPDKVQLNLDYYFNRSFWGDIKIILKTIFRTSY